MTLNQIHQWSVRCRKVTWTKLKLLKQISVKNSFVFFSLCDDDYYLFSNRRGEQTQIKKATGIMLMCKSIVSQWFSCKLKWPRITWRPTATKYSPSPTPLPLLLTMEFDSKFIGGSSEGNTSSGGWAWERGAAEENISSKCRFSHWVTQGRKALSAIDALIGQGPVEWATAVERLDWWRLLPMLHENNGWRRYYKYNNTIITLHLSGLIKFRLLPLL